MVPYILLNFISVLAIEASIFLLTYRSFEVVHSSVTSASELSHDEDGLQHPVKDDPTIPIASTMGHFETIEKNIAYYLQRGCANEEEQRVLINDFFSNGGMLDQHGDYVGPPSNKAKLKYFILGLKDKRLHNVHKKKSRWRQCIMDTTQR
jgi:hypothetical protein